MFKVLLLVLLCSIFVSSATHVCTECQNFTALNEVNIAILGTNDIHGTAFPTNMRRSDTNQAYTYGGLVYMSSLIQTIRNEYGPENTLLMDAGDEFQGGIEASSLVSSGKIMNDFFNANKYSASTIGNHEFDFGPQFLFPYLNRFPSSTVLTANIYSETGQPANLFLPNTKRSKIVTVGQDIKVGIIGLTTTETPQTTSGFTSNLFPAYQFRDYAEIVINESKALKLNGAEIIVIVSHVGNTCPGQSLDLSLWKNTTSQTACPTDDIVNLIDAIPEGTVDAVVQGHRHVIAHFYKNNIPVIGSINGGYYLNAIYLKFNKKTRKIVDSTIEGPIPVCAKVLANTKRCEYVPPESIGTVGELQNWNFHGVQVAENKRTKFVFEEYAVKMAPFFEFIVNNEVYLTRDKANECPLCNLMSDLLLETVDGADVSLLNTGGFRSTWIPGVIQYQHFYNMFPFKNNIQTVLLTGAELRTMFQVLQAGPNGFYTAGNLKMKVQRSPRQLLEIKFLNGSDIVDTAEYKMVTIDFLIGGGDDMKDVINKTYTPRNLTTVSTLRDALRPRLEARGTITQAMVLDPSNPRLEFV